MISTFAGPVAASPEVVDCAEGGLRERKKRETRESIHRAALELAHGLLHGVQHRLGIAIGIDFLLVGGHIEQEIGNIAAGIDWTWLVFGREGDE